jgi:hypothetical protein
MSLATTLYSHIPHNKQQHSVDISDVAVSLLSDSRTTDLWVTNWIGRDRKLLDVTD